jgi:hypothetical protein
MLAPTRIKPPSTNAKAALPTESIYDDAQRVFSLIEDERHMSALSLYSSVMERLTPLARLSPSNVFKRPKKDKGSDAEQQARELIEEKKKELETLEVGPECEAEEELSFLLLYYDLRHAHPITPCPSYSNSMFLRNVAACFERPSKIWR